ncbi:hypothetical protein ACUW90_001943 [Staphylococcus simulans]|uniref:hypothetical protein n=1 Tax=Staphylococcus simulans TaxID=1286 RepID=UPI0030BEA082
MSVEVKGIPQLIKQLERKFGYTKMREIEDEALNDGADHVVELLARNFEVFKDTGASIDEITKSKPTFSGVGNSARSIYIKWEGPMDRFRIIHLNEHGYTRNGIKYTPRGFGVIAKTLKQGENAYRKKIVDSLRRNI